MAERCVVETCIQDAVKRVRTERAPVSDRYSYGLADASLSLPVCEKHGNVASAIDQLYSEWSSRGTRVGDLERWLRKNEWPDPPRPTFAGWGQTPSTEQADEESTSVTDPPQTV